MVNVNVTMPLIESKSAWDRKGTAKMQEMIGKLTATKITWKFLEGVFKRVEKTVDATVPKVLTKMAEKTSSKITATITKKITTTTRANAKVRMSRTIIVQVTGEIMWGLTGRNMAK